MVALLKRRVPLLGFLSVFLGLAIHLGAQAKPHVLGIAGDDIGWHNTSICNRGDTGYQPPSFGRIGKQGAMFIGPAKGGLPGSDIGLAAKDLSVAEVKNSHRYATGKFGGNHLSDRDEPQNSDYPKLPSFRAKYGTRCFLHCWATNTDDPAVDPGFVQAGMKKLDNTGRLP